MPYTVVPVVVEDVPDMCKIMNRALNDGDVFWKAVKGSIAPKDEFEFTRGFSGLDNRVRRGVELGTCGLWKVVDENGYDFRKAANIHL